MHPWLDHLLQPLLQQLSSRPRSSVVPAAMSDAARECARVLCKWEPRSHRRGFQGEKLSRRSVMMKFKHFAGIGATTLLTMGLAVPAVAQSPNAALKGANGHDYMSDPAGNSGNRIACGVISESPATVGRSPAR